MEKDKDREYYVYDEGEGFKRILSVDTAQLGDFTGRMDFYVSKDGRLTPSFMSIDKEEN